MVMFEKASKMKLRFACDKGNLTTEDLWDLTDKDLDKMYIDLAKGKKSDETESLINPHEDKTLILKLEIVKHIFTVKREEAKASKDKIETKRQNDRILEIIAKKSDAELEGKSVEELQAMVDADK